MAVNKREFTLVGKFDDQITPAIKKLNKTFAAFQRSLERGVGKTLTGFEGQIEDISRKVVKLEGAFGDVGRAAGKTSSVVGDIGTSLGQVAKAANQAEESVAGIGRAAGRANGQAEDLMTTLLKAEGLSKVGDAIAKGFDRGMSAITKTAAKGAGVVGKMFREAMEDEMADIKAASGIQGSFSLAGYKGEFKDAQKMYKAYDQVVSEMIRQSSAPTAKVVELQRYTLDTLGPLMLAAQGVPKGTAMKDIDPKKIKQSAQQYGAFLEKAALFSQGTGSAGFRVAAGIEQLVTRGKIDTQLDFFTDNILLMKNLEDAGFAGRGARTSDLMNATDAKRFAKMMEAFNKSMSGESTAAMAKSLTGSLQGLQDTIFNPSVGILGMSVTFSEEEQKKANAVIRKIQNQRIKAYKEELKSTKISEERAKQLRINIEQAEKTRDQLIGDNDINTPFKAFSYAFTEIVRRLTEALNAIGPVWTNFATAAIEVTNKVFGPLSEALKNVASDMRGGKVTQAEGFGRIIGEVFKTIGTIMGDLANMISDPKSAMGKARSEFMKGFMAAFEKYPGGIEKVRENIAKGFNALIGKLFEVMMSIVTSEEFRPLVLPALALMFGPPLISAVISGAAPLLISAFGKIASGLVAKVMAKQAITTTAASSLGMNARYLMGGAAGAGAAGAGAGGGGGALAAVGGVAGITVAAAALAAALVIFQKPVLAFAKTMENWGKTLQQSTNMMVSAAGVLIEGLSQTLAGVTNFFSGMWDFVSGLLTGDKQKVINGVKRVFNGIQQTLTGIGNSILGLGGIVLTAAINVLKTLAEVILEAGKKFKEAIFGAEPITKPGGATTKVQTVGTPSPQTSPRGRWVQGKGNKYWVASPNFDGNGKLMPLNSAISSEMANKPPGSDLVIANSSETVIPAAGGYGMGAFIDAIASGFAGVKNSFLAVSNGLSTFKKDADEGFKQTNKQISGYHSETQTQIAKINQNLTQLTNQVQQMSSMGGMGGGLFGTGAGAGGAAKVVAIGRMLQGMGLRVAENPNFGSGRVGVHAPGSYHYLGRAIDVTGPDALLDQAYARLKGTNPAELLWRTAGHYDHLHVAYALGAANPAFFGSQSAAKNWEASMVGASKVRSITTNTGESLGGSYTIHAPITIHQQPGQDSEELAAVVAVHLGNAIREARASSIRG